LILGVSLGVGIPVLLIVIGGFILYKKKYTAYSENSTDSLLTGTDGKTTNATYVDPFSF
jgi:hypothetical protein